jgi:hypothetical protein
VFGSRKVERGWNDLLAVRRNDLIRAWDHLTQSALVQSDLAYPLQGELSFVQVEGIKHRRWQLKLSQTEGARIWYFVFEKTVVLERIFTAHPNQTKK